MRWIRRSRLGWRWVDGIDAPVGEEREAYRLTIVTGFGTVRIVELGDPSFLYTAAMIAADGGRGGAITVTVTQTGSFAASFPARLTILYD